MNIISFQELQLKPSFNEYKFKTYEIHSTNRLVQVMTGLEKKATQKLLIDIIKSIAVIIFTGCLALFFEKYRHFCIQSFSRKMESTVYVDWTTLPENQIVDLLNKDGLLIQYGTKEMREKAIYAQTAIQQNGSALEFVLEPLQKDKNYISLALQSCKSSSKLVKEAALSLVKRNGMALKDLSNCLREDRDIVMAAIEENEMAIEFAADSLKADLEIGYCAYLKSPLSLQYLPKKAKQKLLAFLEMFKRYDPNTGLNPFPQEYMRLRKIVLLIVEKFPLLLHYAAHPLNNDPEIVRTAVGSNGKAFQFASSNLKKDKNFILKLLADFPPSNFFSYAKELHSDRRFIKELLKENPSNPEDTTTIADHIDTELRKDRAFMLDIIKINGFTYKIAVDSLKEDKELALAAMIQSRKRVSAYIPLKIKEEIDECINHLNEIEKDYRAFSHIPDELKKQKYFLLNALKVNIKIWDLSLFPESIKTINFIQEALHYNGNIWNLLPTELQNQKEIALAAVMGSPAIFEKLPEGLRGDKEIALVAVESDGQLLEFVSKELREDPEVVLAATKNSEPAWEYVSKTLLEKKEFILSVLKINEERIFPQSLSFIPEKFLEDKEIVLKILKTNPEMFSSIKEKKIKDDKEVILTVLVKNPQALMEADLEIRKDKNFILEAVSLKGVVPTEFLDDREVMGKYVKTNLTFNKCGQKLKEDGTFILECINNAPLNWSEVPYTIWESRRNICMALKRNPRIFAGLAEYLKGEKSFVLNAAKSNGSILSYVTNEQLLADEEIFFEAVRSGTYTAFEFASQNLKENKNFVRKLIDLDGMILVHASPELQKDEELVKLAVAENPEVAQFLVV